MPKNEAYTAEQVIAALKTGKGYVSQVAGILGCDATTVYNYAKRYPTVAKAWQDIREERHDFVESKLAQRIDGGDTTAMIFYLKTQCKSRGYIERQELEHSGGMELTGTVTIYLPSNGRGDSDRE